MHITQSFVLYKLLIHVLFLLHNKNFLSVNIPSQIQPQCIFLILNKRTFHKISRLFSNMFILKITGHFCLRFAVKTFN